MVRASTRTGNDRRPMKRRDCHASRWRGMARKGQRTPLRAASSRRCVGRSSSFTYNSRHEPVHRRQPPQLGRSCPDSPGVRFLRRRVLQGGTIQPAANRTPRAGRSSRQDAAASAVPLRHGHAVLGPRRRSCDRRRLLGPGYRCRALPGQELRLDARFIETDVYKLSEVLSGSFDVVFAS